VDGCKSDRNSTANYANHLRIEFNPQEVLLSFGHAQPHREEPVMAARIVTTPLFARDFLMVLERALKQLESEASTGGGAGEVQR
jgi:hypothetical protein